MYGALFDAAILEQNEGTLFLVTHNVECTYSTYTGCTIMIDIYQHIGLPVSGNEQARWLKIVNWQRTTR